MWIDPNTQEIFKQHDEIRSAFPNVSFPAVITPPDIDAVGLVSVSIQPSPQFDYLTQKVVEDGVVNVDGIPTQQWKVVELTIDEQSAVKQNLQKQIVDVVQQRLDDFARTRGYDGILSACSYATSPSPRFHVEGQYCVQLRDSTWEALYQILGEVEAGTRPMTFGGTGFPDIIKDLPVPTWPQ